MSVLITRNPETPEEQRKLTDLLFSLDHEQRILNACGIPAHSKDIPSNMDSRRFHKALRRQQTAAAVRVAQLRTQIRYEFGVEE
jgi:hypothetical protein